MANSVDIRPRLVDFRMNEEACRIPRLGLFCKNASQLCFGVIREDGTRGEDKYLVSTDNFPSPDIEADQITGCHETKVLPEWVHPDVVLEFGVADGYVAGHSFGEAFAGEVSEDGGRVDEDVFAVFGVG